MNETTRPIFGAAEAVEEAEHQLAEPGPQPGAQPLAQAELKVLLVNGPNLNLLGQRDPGIYGSTTLQEIEERMTKRAREMEVDLRCFQSNHEGDIVDFIQREGQTAAGIIINPGALTHSSYVIRDALEVANKPTIEVHISNIHSREMFRRRTITGEMADAVIAGFGWRGYLMALEALFQVPVVRKERK